MFCVSVFAYFLVLNELTVTTLMCSGQVRFLKYISDYILHFFILHILYYLHVKDVYEV